MYVCECAGARLELTAHVSLREKRLVPGADALRCGAVLDAGIYILRRTVSRLDPHEGGLRSRVMGAALETRLKRGAHFDRCQRVCAVAGHGHAGGTAGLGQHARFHDNGAG